MTPNSTRPSSRADRRIRFAELEPEDVHVYESAPASPKRRVLALPPPDHASSDGDTVSLGQWKGKMVAQDSEGSPEISKMSPELLMPVPLPVTTRGHPEEGSAEYIRRRYFPDAPKDDPNLAWMQMDSIPSDSTSSTLRFDLQGNPIPPSVSLSLPTHLGLHHHAEGAHAGYTLDDIFLLSRSTVPAQRATMLDVLTRISRRIADVARGRVDGMEEIVGKEEELRKRILAAGIEAISEKGSVGAHAIEVVWSCIVGWNPDLVGVEGAELESPSDSTINTLPLDFLLHQVTTILSQGAALPESRRQLLSVLHRLAQQSILFSNTIATTPKLLTSVLQTFLLTPISQDSSSPLPDPFALQFFHILILSSRTCAVEIEKLADSFLRFIAFLPPSSPYPPPLAASILTWTLRIYRDLASYGLYCHVAGDAITQLSRLEQYIISETCSSYPLKVAWANLVEVWTTCAIDPHQTTPEHDVTWSQVVGWGWDAGLLELQSHLNTEEKDWGLWDATWNAQSAWLEGSKTNGIRGGEGERLVFLESVRPMLEDDGRVPAVVDVALVSFEEALTRYQTDDTDSLKKISRSASILSAIIRLWLACIPPHLDGPPSTPPFTLPFSRLSQLSASLVVHPLWLTISSDSSFNYLLGRQISGFLASYLGLARRLPGVSEGLWMGQAFSIIVRLCAGDEDISTALLEQVMKMLTPEWTAARRIHVPPVIWEKGGLFILEPFFARTIRPQSEVCIGPLTVTPRSIKSSTTQRLPSPNGLKNLGLPLHRDWAMTPLDHLLRSVDSAVFKALPASWDSSEVEVTRAALFLTKVVQEALLNFSITSVCVTREEATFRCMQVFMLEHGQSQNDSSDEVFRDAVVGKLMEDLLTVYVNGNPTQFPSSTEQLDLEKVAARFLGPSVPFFQFYTDFVALYDAISFSHPLFAALLLPPTSMRYALDYRKHLWCDFNHIVKTIRTPVERILTVDVVGYLYPIEKDAQILGSYLSSLLKNDLHEFPRLVALHHVASNIWPDLQGAHQGNEEQSSVMLKAVVQRGGNDVVREVVLYRQDIPSSGSTNILLPPVCFEGLSGEVRSSRMSLINRWGGSAMLSRLDGLLNNLTIP